MICYNNTLFAILVLLVGCASPPGSTTEPQVVLSVYESSVTLEPKSRMLDVYLEVGMKSVSYKKVKVQPFMPYAFDIAGDSPSVVSLPHFENHRPTVPFTKNVLLGAEEQRLRINLGGRFFMRATAAPVTNDVIAFDIRYDQRGIFSNPVRLELMVR